MSDKVSVVVPVYNAEDFLRQGLDSLLEQTYQNVEIVLIDDQSTDNSWQICREYAAKHPNISTFQTEENTGGPFCGRRLGIGKATGKWITFMDCDDFVSKRYVEHLVAGTNNGKFDISVTGHCRAYEDGRKEDFLWQDYSRSTSERLAEFYSHFIKADFWTDPTDTIGQNLVRAEVAKSTDLSKIPNNIWAEDTFMALAFLANSKNGINFVDFHDYFWRQREGSGSHGGFSSRADRNSFYSTMQGLFQKNLCRFSEHLPLISVIVPSYNVEGYIRECADSLLHQEYDHLEIILVDDGSSDTSGKICDELAESDSRIKVIHQENSGTNIARKNGFNSSQGELIMFVDGDDMVSKDCVRKLFEMTVRNEVDIAIAGYKNFTDKQGLEPASQNYSTLNEIHSKGPILQLTEETLREKRSIIRFYLTKESCGIGNVYQVVPWGRLFDRGIIENTDWHFSNYQTNEDEFESLQWFNSVERGIAVSNEQLYFYRQNPRSKMLSAYKNTDPNGRELNRFELARVLYQETRSYLNDPSLENDLLWRYNLHNQYFLDRRIEANDLVPSEIKTANENYQEIIADKDRMMITLRESCADLEAKNLEMLNSRTWKFGKIAQRLGTPLLEFKEKLRIRTRIRSLKNTHRM